MLIKQIENDCSRDQRGKAVKVKKIDGCYIVEQNNSNLGIIRLSLVYLIIKVILTKAVLSDYNVKLAICTVCLEHVKCVAKTKMNTERMWKSNG